MRYYATWLGMMLSVAAALLGMAGCMSTRAGHPSWHLPGGRGCEPAMIDESILLRREIAAVGPVVWVSPNAVPPAEWEELPSDVAAWIGPAGVANWAALGKCSLDLRPFGTPQTRFLGAPAELLCDDGWVFVGRVAFSSDRQRAAVLVWGLPYNPPNTQPPLVVGSAGLYEMQDGEWHVRDVPWGPFPNRPSRLMLADPSPDNCRRSVPGQPILEDWTR